MSESFHVRVTKDYLVFSAAHFVTFNRDVCERLHGHNYRVAAEVFGPLDENHFVVDFVALRETLKLLVDELDHRVLLPTSHPEIQVEADDRRVRATFRDLEWVFPRGDCVLLPVANTTAELIASYLGHRLLDALEIRTGTRPGISAWRWMNAKANGVFVSWWANSCRRIVSGFALPHRESD